MAADTHFEVIENRLAIATGTVKQEYTQEIAQHIGIEPLEVESRRFPDGELYNRYGESIRGTDLFIMAPMINGVVTPDGRPWSVNDGLKEVNVLLDAGTAAGAKRRVLFIPYLPYSRQERKDESGEPISARSTINEFICNGMTRIMTMDLHAPAIQGFVPPEVGFDRIPGKPLLKAWIKDRLEGQNLDEWVLVSPDAGRTGVVESYAGTLYREGFDLKTAGIEKRRLKHDEDPVIVGVQGDVSGKNCIIIDDMISTGGTTVRAADALFERNALSVDVVASHGILAGNAIEKLKQSQIGSIALTDVLLTDEKIKALEGKIEPIETGKFFAALIEATFRNQSLSEIYDSWPNISTRKDHTDFSWFSRWRAKIASRCH